MNMYEGGMRELGAYSDRLPELLKGLPESFRDGSYLDLRGAVTKKIIGVDTYLSPGPYTEERMAQKLASPTAYADGAVLREPRRPHQLDVEPEVYDESSFYPPTSRSLFIGRGRNVYEGPIYRQEGPTCNAWATIHAVSAAGARVSPALATTMVNEALPNGDKVDGGMNVFAAAARVVENDDSLVVKHVGVTGQRGSAAVAQLVRSTIDDGAALVACISYREAPWRQQGSEGHAVAIVGYEDDANGNMVVQVVDSGMGEEVAMTPARIAGEISTLPTLAPPFAIISRK